MVIKRIFRHSHNPPQYDTSDDECDDGDTNWYEVSFNNLLEGKSSFCVEGRRIIDIDYFYRGLQEICNHNKALGCTLSNVHILSEKRKGLLSKYKLGCNFCNQTFCLDSEPKSNLDLNKSATSGIISSGIGYSQFSELCASMDCPSFSPRHYAKLQNETYDDWQKTAIIAMETAAVRERNAAIAEGRVKNGIACIDVIADGVWSKRSFNTNFSALSGAAAIIGKRFGEVLFIGVKNKYCCICARAESKGIRPGDHVCYKNYSGSSTGMESKILLEGFKQSISMHNLTYERMVADGDSCTYKKNLECRPYPNCTVEKIINEHQHLTQTLEYKPGWSFYLVLAGVATTLGSSLPVGYNIGVVNTPAEVIKTFCNESFISRYNLPLDDTWLSVLWSSIVSIFIIGGCTGSVLGSVLANKLGRKNATIVTSALSIAGALLFLLCRAANAVEMLIVGRLLVGLSAGLTTSIVPMYLTELSPLRLTGAMGVACPMGVNVGVLVGQVMGLNFFLGGVDDWPYLLSVYALLVIICLPVLCILPESPKYLFIVKRNEDTAVKELSRLRGVSESVLVEELEALREERDARGSAGGEARGAWSMRRLLASHRLRLPLLLLCAAQAGQQTSGINAVFYYSQMIFKQAGLTEAGAQYATIACGLINVCTAALMLRMLPRAGRRPLLLASSLGAALALAALAAAMTAINTVSWMPYVCMIAVLLYVLVYGFGLGPIPYFIGSEMFEVGPRPAGMAWGSLANWGGNFLVGMCFPTMRRAIGSYSFFIFSAITAALFFFMRAYLPETRGSTPAQVTQKCANGLRSRPLSRQHTPV
ncbi:unnamed protein product [Parnassius apollo]|uniref:(apollo) hypothetical protein n=1 Tax=Parnassius apollo TaxID=110799 RepID=A0A8S3Y4U8_PARAO|nr:unnamed protein product [Parnassius apollo]